jgi:hypothetical protein
MHKILEKSQKNVKTKEKQKNTAIRSADFVFESEC